MSAMDQEVPCVTRLRETMHYLGKSVDQVATEVGLGTRTLYSYLSGKVVVPDELRAPLAKALHCEQDYLFPHPSQWLPEAHVPGVHEAASNGEGKGLQSIPLAKRGRMEEVSPVAVPAESSFHATTPKNTRNMPNFMTLQPPFAHPEQEILPFLSSQQHMWYNPALPSEEWQMSIHTLLENMEKFAGHMGMEDFGMSRRQILIALATWPFTVDTSKTISSETVQEKVFLSRCASSLVACNHLFNQSYNFWEVKQVLTGLLPPLLSIVHRSSPSSTIAAHLTAQCYVMLAILESHQLNWAGYHTFNMQALQMSLLTADVNLQIMTHAQLAMAFFHLGQPSKALALYEKVSPLVSKSSSLVQSNFL